MARFAFLAAALAACAVTTLTWGFGGPDLVICRVGGTSTSTGFSNLTNNPVNGVRAFSAESITCNYGDVQCVWDAGLPEPDNNHPIISQSMFRLRNGRLSQIGQSWAKHAGNSTNQPECGLTCVPPQPSNNSILVVGCCDAYSALTNATQFAGPKSEVNPSTGYFPYPFCSPADGGMVCPAPEASIGRRLQVADADIDTAAGVLYFMQLHIVTPDEIAGATPRSDYNNCSYRPFSFAANHNISAWSGVTMSAMPAIKAWKLNGLGPGVTDPDVIESIIDVPGDGRFYLAAKATNMGGGLWQYEYAVQNYNSDRAAGSFSMTLPVGIVLQNVFFHDVDSHSGEPYSNTDWPFTTTPTSISWATVPFATNPNANSLRWDTLYNFRFQCNKPPANRLVTLGLFKPGARGAPNAMSVLLPAPDNDCNNNLIADTVDIANATSLDANADGVPDECQSPCPADINHSGAVNTDDLLAIISGWGTCPIPTNCPADIFPPARDGVVNADDLLLVISAWGTCPAP